MPHVFVGMLRLTLIPDMPTKTWDTPPAAYENATTTISGSAASCLRLPEPDGVALGIGDPRETAGRQGDRRDKCLAAQ